MCYCLYPVHRTGQNGVLWQAQCSSPGLSPQVACFSDPWPPEATHARTLSKWLLSAINLSIPGQEEVFSYLLARYRIQSLTHCPPERRTRGCSRWLSFLIWVHSFVHWSSFQVSYCSDATERQSSSKNYKLPSAKGCSSIKGVLRRAWSRNPAAQKEAQSSWWVHLTSTIPLSLSLCLYVSTKRLKLGKCERAAPGFISITIPYLGPA